jgi:hypothetical protein
MANWIPTTELTDVELHHIKALKEGRGNEGILKMLSLVEENVVKLCRESKGIQLFRAQGVAQFLEELSEIIKLK